MEFSNFVRKPFVVEAVEVAAENIAEIAPMVGELIEGEKESPYIRVNPRVVPNVSRVFPGFWLTRMNGRVHCYNKKLFKEQFTEATTEITDWVNYVNGQKAEDVEETADAVEANVFEEPVQPEGSILG